MRRWSLVFVLGSTLLALTVAGCRQGGGGETTPTSAPSPTAPVTAATAPDGGTLRVAEEGISQIKDSTGKPMVSFGVVLESTSKTWIASGTAITVALADDSGKAVEDQIEHGKYSVHATLPQQKSGVGAQIYVGAPGATKLQVTIGTSTWYPKSYPGLAAITASAVKTQRKTDTATFSFALTSAYGRSVNGQFINIIFRDQSGRLIGGAGLDLTKTCGTVPRGASTCTTGTTYALPDGTADARTEVYVDGT